MLSVRVQVHCETSEQFQVFRSLIVTVSRKSITRVTRRRLAGNSFLL